jgi:predicted DNA-binding protein YlxM (UPF0122 family)
MPQFKKKLVADDIVEIVKLFNSGKFTVVEIAKKFDVSRSRIDQFIAYYRSKGYQVKKPEARKIVFMREVEKAAERLLNSGEFVPKNDNTTPVKAARVSEIDKAAEMIKALETSAVPEISTASGSGF